MGCEGLSVDRIATAAAGVALITVSALLGVGCRAAFRYPVETYESETPEEDVLLAGMNPYVLTDLVSDRIVFEVDWVEGVEPHPAALEGLRKTLSNYLPEGKQVEIDLDDPIPLAQWQEAEGPPSEKVDLLARWLDRDPRAQDGADLVYIVYVPDPGEYVGLATQLYFEDEDGLRVVQVLFIHLESISKESFLWITTRKVEQAILVHEVGHVLGLVSNPEHVEQDNPRHCTEPQCVMAHFRTKSQVYNALPALFAGQIPDDFCNKCRADINAVQETWRLRAAEDPQFVQRLRDRRAVETLRMEACWYASRDRWGESVARLGEARELAISAGLEIETMEGDDEVLMFNRCPEM